MLAEPIRCNFSLVELCAPSSPALSQAPVSQELLLFPEKKIKTGNFLVQLYSVWLTSVGMAVAGPGQTPARSVRATFNDQSRL